MQRNQRRAHDCSRRCAAALHESTRRRSFRVCTTLLPSRTIDRQSVCQGPTSQGSMERSAYGRGNVPIITRPERPHEHLRAKTWIQRLFTPPRQYSAATQDHHPKAEAIVVHQLTPRVIVNALIDQLFVIWLENGGFAERARSRASPDPAQPHRLYRTRLTT